MEEAVVGMKASTIKLVIHKKIESWLSSIDDISVREAARRDAIVTGGCIASMLLGEKPNDYDVYFKTDETTRQVAEYYVNVFNRMNKVAGIEYKPVVRDIVRKNCKGIDEKRIVIWMQSAGVVSATQSEYKYFESMDPSDADGFISSLSGEEQLAEEAVGNPLEVAETYNSRRREAKLYEPVFFSENAISLKGKMQLVIRFYGQPSDIHDNYDYAHCMCWYDHSTRHLELPSEAIQALLSKSLVYRGSLYPVASIFRLRKFLKRGFRITAGQLLKIMWQISELNLKDPEVLKEQLIGVDVAYMRQLVDALNSSKDAVDGAYLAKLVDEIFE